MSGYLTVQELVQQLLSLPQDLPVYTEGCDCVGPASKAEQGSGPIGHETEQVVYINRNHELERS